MTRSRDVSAVQNNLGVAIPPAAAGKNAVINGGFDIWQRGTSVSVSAASNAYTADRWQLFTQANQASTVSRQATSDSTNLPNIQYCARVQRNSGQTGAGQMSFIQGMETVNSIPFAGKTVTLSFYARAGANFSPTSSTFNFMIYTGTGTDQFPTSYTGGATVATATNNLTTTWTRYSVTGTIATSATEIGIYAYWVATGTAGAADYVEITGVQLELGSTATPFSRAGGTIQGELAACQRYYQRFGAKNGINVGNNATYGYGFITSSTGANYTINFPVTMRTNPSAIEYSSLIAYDSSLNQFTPSAVTLITGQTGLDAGNVQFTISGATAGRASVIIQSAGTGYLAFSAEL